MNIFDIVARAYPLIIQVIVLGHFIGTRNKESIYLFVWFLFNEFINKSSKLLLKSVFKDKEIPILGKGERPQTKNCGMIADGSKSSSYGTPSGHSQFASFFSLYSVLVINDLPIEQAVKYVYFVLLGLVAIWIMYTRLQFKCHTIQQIIFGALIGGILAFIAYKIKKTTMVNKLEQIEIDFHKKHKHSHDNEKIHDHN
jgi:dolichyldiphosphatase